jgi:hypothetical protein
MNVAFRSAKVRGPRIQPSPSRLFKQRLISGPRSFAERKATLFGWQHLAKAALIEPGSKDLNSPVVEVGFS